MFIKNSIIPKNRSTGNFFGCTAHHHHTCMAAKDNEESRLKTTWKLLSERDELVATHPLS